MLFGAVVALSYCTTAPKTASSFGKRKYTKGHFSDPVAKIKTEYSPYSENNTMASPQPNQKEDVDKSNFINKSEKKDIKANFTAATQTLKTTISNQVKQTVGAIANNIASSGNNNVSLKENSSVSSQPYDPGGHPYQHEENNKASTYLLAWLISIIVALICFFLFVGEANNIANGGSAAVSTGCLLLTLMVIAFIAAIVFLILWIVALSN